jgi:hypothetical protein
VSVLPCGRQQRSASIRGGMGARKLSDELMSHRDAWRMLRETVIDQHAAIRPGQIRVAPTVGTTVLCWVDVLLVRGPLKGGSSQTGVEQLSPSCGEAICA